MTTGHGGTPAGFDISAGLQGLLDVAEFVIMTAPVLALTLTLAVHLRTAHQRPGHSASVWATRSIAGSRHLFGETSAKEFRRQAQAERRGHLAAHH